MAKIERISGPQTRLPARSTGARRAEDMRRSPHSPADHAAAEHGVSGYKPAMTGFRVSTPFLAQYVDQHWHWPRDPARKEGIRQRAAAAYLQADELPERLEETALTGRYGKNL